MSAATVPVTIPEDAWEGDTPGSVVMWVRQDGAVVEAGELIAELAFEKVTMELRAPAAGRLRTLIGVEVPVGKGVPVAEIAPL
jgi:pyruvate/2-oxoglutarate dehydrogenase complex dihydrolipoamide acyltransferase (E2) component